MREMTDEEVRRVCYQALKYIKKVCDENNINYSLTGGTLLGAIRHKGFIPWDDDCDVFLSRPEYEKLRKILQKQTDYLWLDHETNPDYYCNFGRLVNQNTVIIGDGIAEIGVKGIFVDVCVVDGLPDNFLKRKAHIALMRFLVRARNSASFSDAIYIPKNPVKRITKSIFKKYAKSIGVKNWTDRIERIVSKYPFESGKYVGNMMSHYGYKEELHRKGFDNYLEVPFEDTSFKIFKGYEEYLTNIYGDYMTPPPLDKRGGHRVGTAYWRDE